MFRKILSSMMVLACCSNFEGTPEPRVLFSSDIFHENTLTTVKASLADHTITMTVESFPYPLDESGYAKIEMKASMTSPMGERQFQKIDLEKPISIVYTPLSDVIAKAARNQKVCGSTEFEANKAFELPPDCMEIGSLQVPFSIIDSVVQTETITTKTEQIALMRLSKDNNTLAVATFPRDFNLTEEHLTAFIDRGTSHYKDKQNEIEFFLSEP